MGVSDISKHRDADFFKNRLFDYLISSCIEFVETFKVLQLSKPQLHILQWLFCPPPPLWSMNRGGRIDCYLSKQIWHTSSLWPRLPDVNTYVVSMIKSLSQEVFESFS